MVAPTQSLFGPIFKVSQQSNVSFDDNKYHHATKRKSSSLSNDNHEVSTETTTTTTTSSHRNLKNKRVRFVGRVGCKIIENRHHLTKDEKQRSYMSRYELDQIKKEIRAVLRKYADIPNLETIIEQHEEETLGLEGYLPRSHYLDRTRKAKEAVKGVIKLQFSCGGKIVDDQWLRTNYIALTVWSVLAAKARGMKHHQSDTASPPYTQVMMR